MCETPKRKGRLTLPDGVRDVELEHLRARRGAAGLGSPDEGTAGLALSGGGIRSSTFCLGVLQSLVERRVFRLVDWLSTVSGGGYVGSCVSSLFTIPRDHRVVDPAFDKETFGWEPDRMPLTMRQQIHHLRTHGDFLITRKGLFQAELLRSVGSYALGLVSSLLFVLSLLALALGVLLLLGEAYTGGMLGWAARDGAGGLWEMSLDASGFWWWALGAFLLGIAASCWVIQGGRCRPGRAGLGTPTVKPTAEDLRRLRWRQLWIGLVVPVVLLAVVHEIVGLADAHAALGLEGLLLPTVLFAGGWVAIAAHGATLAREDVKSVRWTADCRSRLGMLQGAATLAVLAGALCLLLAWLASCRTEILGTTLPVLGAVALFALRFLAKGAAPGEEAGGRLAAWGRSVRRAALGVALVVLFVALSVLLTVWSLSWLDSPALDFLLLTGAGVLVFALLPLLVDFNRVSPHYFYRDRLADAYLRTAAGGVDGGAILRDDASLPLRNLHGRAVGGANPAPYHLVQCAVNLPGSRDLARKDRRSDHFVFSRRFCGSTATGYVPTEDYAGGFVTLAKAMTISGAATSSNMGFHTTLARAVALTMFNIRLGYWLPNPLTYPSRVLPEWETKPRNPEPMREPRSAPRLAPRWWGGWLLREMGCTANLDLDFVNLSDGGHTGDNLGLYPLLQRRCRVIVACDAECDPRFEYGSLASAIRQINTDENVRIDIQPDVIGDGRKPGGISRHFVVGRIEYPDCTREGDSAPHRRPAVGWLIYVKSSFFDREEPAPVKSYAQKNPRFPHQPTSDQFFDDDQFEAYRALGHHVAERLWEAVFDGRVPEEEPTLDDLERFCRRAWGCPEATRSP